jgi:hypothetical protein
MKHLSSDHKSVNPAYFQLHVFHIQEIFVITIKARQCADNFAKVRQGCDRPGWLRQAKHGIG